MDLLFLFFLLLCAGLVVWGYVAALVNAAKAGKWIWFVLMLFFQWLAAIYLLVAWSPKE